MGRKNRWHASPNGPDWTDVAMTLREVEKLHSVWCSVRMLSDGSHASSSLRIVCSALGNELVRPAVAGVVMVTDHWPTKDGLTITGVIYRLLLKLDHELLERNWVQTELPLEA